MRPSRRKLAVGLAALVAAPLFTLAVVPLLFADRVAARARAAVTDAVSADVRWRGVRVGLLRDFPNLSVRLDGVSIVGVQRFAGDTLLAAERVRAVVDLGSVLRHVRRGDAVVVREVEVRRPVARFRVLADGAASWDIARRTPGARRGTGGAVAIALRELAVRDARVLFDDRHSDVLAGAAGLEVTLGGDLARDRVGVATRVRARETSLRVGGVPYLHRVALALDADVAVDTRAQRFTFRDNRLRLNDLALALTGAVQLGERATALDLAFATPSTDFASLLSLVPALYARDAAKLQAAGRMLVRGRVRGAYGPHDFPAVALRAEVRGGTFRHAGLPLAARDVALDVAIDNPGGHVDNTVVRLSRFHAALGGRAVDARLVLRSPVRDPDVDVAVRGSLDLGDLRRTVALPGVRELSGVVAGDVAVRTRRSWVDARQYERVAASGTIELSRLALRTASLPHAVAVDSARLRVTPQRVELAALAARVGRSDVRATGAFDNLLGYALRGETLRGEATLASDRLDLNEWRSDDPTRAVPVPPGVDVALRASVAQVLFDKLDVRDVQGAVRLNGQRATLDDVRMRLLRGAVLARGWYDTRVPGRPAVDLRLAVDSVDIQSAFASVVTVGRLAPIARYARGRVSTDLALTGTLGEDLTPVPELLAGSGTLQTADVAIEGFPAFAKLSAALGVPQLRDPAVRALRASFRVANGRVHVQPFAVKLGDVALTASGSGGIDQTLDYDLALAVPTSRLGAGATQSIARLAANTGGAFDAARAASVSIGVAVGGTVADPTVRPTFRGAAASLLAGVKQAARDSAAERVAALRARADSAADEARRRAGAEAARLVAEAEQRASALRAEADSAAARLRREGHARADALVGRAPNPVAKLAAQAAADRVRRETDAQADRVSREADARARAIIDAARRPGASVAGG
jgi:uncharacterized protein involved in outer membrane biogenesis